ncbi:NADH-quinone oxidoreductase subunit NuoG [Alkalisalibacterium limincola]|uniref:NADH-quinone oxidoreductase subunit G n=1 Tax=Alkalisalibacterium limincola TaxID=2699169 RepID=A0A5C8L0Q6_9GAMM|nr:NADH-quinone oxidoreductase subunit NuoG [Alkalisalibacterium limincola]TXK65743.1 NADH-quinone oxidoreductase subunit G [Alkalisalibacterium limincola]
MSAQVKNDQAPDLVSLEIDGREIQAPKGTMIIQAADRAGIPVPRFCYHEKLPIAANCRMCMVDVEKMPKPAPACATPVMDGMKIYTQSKRALDAQRNVMEFLLINHPLDCPICDQGGECELQDVSMGYGRSVSRFNERKRVVADEDLGPLVATEMTRCIHCTRCIRVTAEVAGTHELGGMQRGENLVIGTYDGKPLESELSGNVIDVCPVGALTNKVFRFKARPWELVARESLGYHDALGSNLFLHTRRGDVLRTVPRDNEAVNECWLSDRDRYSHQGLYADDRARVPMLKRDGVWEQVGWDEALAAAAEALRSVPGDQLGVLVHPATSNEEGALLKRLADGLGSGNIDHRLRVADFTDAPVAEAFGMPVADVEQADLVLLVGCNLRHELPLVSQRVLKATKAGAVVHAINPVEFDFPYTVASTQCVAPSALAGAVQAMADGEGDLSKALEAARSAVIFVGEVAEAHPQASRIHAAVRALAAATGARVNRIPLGANAIGLAGVDVLPSAANASQMLADKRGAYLLYGIEPGADFGDNTAAARALGEARVVAFSHYACTSTRDLADVILPIGLLPEIDATLVNVDGIAQRTQSGGKLPGEARPGWRVLRALADTLELTGFEFADIAGLRSTVSFAPKSSGTDMASAGSAEGEGLERITTTPIYRGDAVLRRSAALNAHPLTRGARVVLHPEDAPSHGLSEGAIAKFDDGRGRAALPVALDARVARGCAWIESSYGATVPMAPAGLLKLARD